MTTELAVVPTEIPWEEFACTNRDHQSKESWLQARKGFITASEVATVYNVSPDSYGSRWSLWNEKMGGEVPEASKQMQEIMAFASDDEPLINRRFLARHPERVTFDPGDFALQSSNLHKWLACTLDYLQWDPVKGWGILEEKSVLGLKGPEWDDSGIPKHFMFQAQTQMLVLGLDWGTLAVRIGNQYHEVEFSRHQGFCDNLVDPSQKEGVYEFYHTNMCEEQAPSVDGNEATTKAMADYFGLPQENMVMALESGIELIDVEWQAISRAVKALEKRKRHLSNKVREMMYDEELGAACARGIGDMGIKYGCISVRETIVPEFTRKASNYIKRLNGPKYEFTATTEDMVILAIENGK